MKTELPKLSTTLVVDGRCADGVIALLKRSGYEVTDFSSGSDFQDGDGRGSGTGESRCLKVTVGILVGSAGPIADLRDSGRYSALKGEDGDDRVACA